MFSWYKTCLRQQRSDVLYQWPLWDRILGFASFTLRTPGSAHQQTVPLGGDANISMELYQLGLNLAGWVLPLVGGRACSPPQAQLHGQAGRPQPPSAGPLSIACHQAVICKRSGLPQDRPALCRPGSEMSEWCRESGTWEQCSQELGGLEVFDS